MDGVGARMRVEAREEVGTRVEEGHLMDGVGARMRDEAREEVDMRGGVTAEEEYLSRLTRRKDLMLLTLPSELLFLWLIIQRMLHPVARKSVHPRQLTIIVTRWSSNPVDCHLRNLMSSSHLRLRISPRVLQVDRNQCILLMQPVDIGPT